MKSFGELLLENDKIKQISFGNNKITDIGIEILHPFLFKNSTLNSLSLDLNIGITEKSTPLLIEGISKSGLQYMMIYGTSLNDSACLYPYLVTNMLKSGTDKVDLISK